MKIGRMLAAGSIGFAIAAVALAQTPPPGPPKPGPEHKKLGFFIGKWSGEADMKESPFGPGGKMTWSETCEWFEGGFAVVCHSTGSGPGGPMKGVAILSYSPDQKVYTYYGVGNDGMAMTTIPHGTVKGNTWTYDDESMMGGKSMKTRFIIQETSPTTSTMKWETLGEGGAWTTIMEGKNTKK